MKIKNLIFIKIFFLFYNTTDSCKINKIANHEEQIMPLINNNSSKSLKRTLTAHSYGVSSLALLKNGDLASGGLFLNITIWNLNDGTIKQNLTGHTGYVHSLVVLPNGDLASGSFDQTIRIWSN